MELYNVLCKECDKIGLQDINISELQTKINEIDTEGQKFIYVLIKYNYTINSNTNELPYKAKILKDGRMKIDLNEFPENLIKILWLFIKKHSEKINTDSLKFNNIHLNNLTTSS